MLSAENVAVLDDWAAEVRRLDVLRVAALEGRDAAIREAWALTNVAELARVTGLTRARLYQILGSG